MSQKEKPLNRGDIVVIDFDPQPGTEIMKRRPALVISPKIYNEKSTTLLFCPITSNIKQGAPWQVILPKGKKVEGAIVVDQIKSMDWRARKAKKVEEAAEFVIEEVLAKIATLVS